ncbi:MAG: glycosyltransferase [Kordiimonadaceae bacterium]|nr:glycosyltransferase [Kordiimonadaceae bacterium]
MPFLLAEKSDRMLRAGIMAGLLTERGHDVTWWTSQFSHQHKKFRDTVSDSIVHGYREDGEAAPDLIFLSSLGYRKHISIRRLRDHAGLARKFRKMAPLMPRPDVVLAAYPTIELCAAAIEFCEENGIPCIIDIRDLWPDIIYARLAKPLRRFGLQRTIRFPYYERMATEIFQKAQAVTGLSRGMVNWCADRFDRPLDFQVRDRVFFQSKFPCWLNQGQIDAERTRWLERGVDLLAPKTRFVWSGSLVEETDGATLLDVLEQIPDNLRKSIEIVLCGTGSLVPRIKEMATRLEHVVYAGWVDELALTNLLEHSHVGLLCYLDRFDFQNSIPNKVTDYCNGSMRILTNLTGEIARLTEGTDIRILYPTGNVAALLDIFIEIARRPDQYRKKSKASHDLFVRCFNAANVLTAFAEHIELVAVSPLCPVKPNFEG